MVNNWINYIQRGIYPTGCLLCGTTGSQDMDICTPCLNDLPLNVNHCRICALPLPYNHADRPICGKCLKQHPRFDRCHAPFSYSYPISGLISDFKFNGKLHIGILLAKLFINLIETTDLELPERIIPVPLHPTRLQERGFNQAMELAKPIANHFDIPLDIQSCRRTRATQTQSSLDKKIRMKNMRGAFEVVKQIECEHLVLIDDVVTTGSTTNELAKVIKSTGVKKVDVWALARTP